MGKRRNHVNRIGAESEQADSVTSEVERQLRETVERYELIFKATNDVLYELDLQKGTVVWNEALYTQYGYKKNDSVNTLEWWTGHIHPEDALLLEHKLSSWFEGGADSWQAEYRFRKADGRYVYIRDRGVVHRAFDGTPRRIIGSFLDITKQKQLDRAKDEFISLVSHQLRTPLTIIRLYSEMLSNGLFGDLNDEQADHVLHITEASVRLIELVGDILNISRVELGNIIIKPVPLDANALIFAKIEELLPLANENGKKIIFQPDKRIKKVKLDKTGFDQILQNLLTNALRYTAKNKGVVAVYFVQNDDGYLLTVRDNGIGIPKAAQQRIFNRFYRADNTVNIQEHGTGLGLYLVKLMTDSFGGKVWFKSEKGHGTTFYLKIPSHGMQIKY